MALLPAGAALAAVAAPGDVRERLTAELDDVRAALTDPSFQADLSHPSDIIRDRARSMERSFSRAELSLDRHLAALDRLDALRERRENVSRKLAADLSAMELEAAFTIEEIDQLWRDAVLKADGTAAIRSLVEVRAAQVDEARAALDEELQSRRLLTDRLKSASPGAGESDVVLGDIAAADARVRLKRVFLQLQMAERDAMRANLALEEFIAAGASQIAQRASELSPMDPAGMAARRAELDRANQELNAALIAAAADLRDRQLIVARTSRDSAGMTAEGTSTWLRAYEGDALLAELVMRELRTEVWMADVAAQLLELRYSVQNERSRSAYDKAVKLIRDSGRTARSLDEVAANELGETQRRIEGIRIALAETTTSAERQELTAYGDTQRAIRDLYGQFMESLDEFEADLGATRLHLDFLMSGTTSVDRVIEALGAVGARVGSIWDYELFEVTETIEVDGQTITGSRSITVWKVVSALLLVTLGVVIAVALGRALRRVLVARGSSETTAMLGYRLFNILVVVVLFMTALNIVNIPFTTFSFLGGALAIGVGFGAQNLVNNFISGIILLLEKPVRIGDVIEVDGVLGNVVSIGARYSRVRRTDGVDELLPNSVLLEHKVTNLTLADANIRVKISVGVAYGSSTREASRRILAAAEEHGLILDNPAPFVIFEEFGDSSLVFTVYFWVTMESGSSWMVIASDVRHIIDRQLREAGITIAFPQRDVHLDVPETVDVRLHGSGGAYGADRADVIVDAGDR
jgi:small-conductance mechanosensitive channel